MIDSAGVADKLDFSEVTDDLTISYTTSGSDTGATAVSGSNTLTFNGQVFEELVCSGDCSVLFITGSTWQFENGYSVVGASHVTVQTGATLKTADGNALSIDARHITIGDNATLQAYTTVSTSAGNITLNAFDLTEFAGFLILNLRDPEAKIEIGSGVTIYGADVDIIATADSSRHWQDDSGATSIAESIANFVETITLIGGVSISHATATVSVGNGSSITAYDLTIKADAISEAKIFALSLGLGFAWVESDPTARVTIGDEAAGGATVMINVAHDLTIEAKANGTLSGSVMVFYFGKGSGVPVDVGFAVGKSTIIAEALVYDNSNIHVGGNFNLNALAEKNLSVSTSVGAYEDGMVAVALGLLWNTTTVTASLDGVVTMDCVAHWDTDESDKLVIGKLDLTVNADLNTIKNDVKAGAGVGSGLGGKVIMWLLRKLPTSKILDAMSKKFPSFSQGGATPAFSASFAYSDETNTVTARIAPYAVVTSQSEDITVHARSLDIPEIASIATIDSNKKSRYASNKKSFSVAIGVLVGLYNNNSYAYIGNGAQVNAGGNIYVNAEAQIPFEIQFLDIQGVGDIMDKANTNLGIQNGLFTSWAQTNAEGTKAAIAGSINVLIINNSAMAYIDYGALINKTFYDASKPYGYVSVVARTLTETINLAGVIGIMVWGGGTKAGKAGIGGSVAILKGTSLSLATIKDGVELYAKGLELRSDMRALTVMIVEAGGKADSFAANGVFSLVNVDNISNAILDDGATIVLTPDANCLASGECLRIPKYFKYMMGRQGDMMFGIPGIIWLIEQEPLILDSDGDGNLDTDDDHITRVDPGGTDKKTDDVYVTDLSLLVGAQDRSQIYNVAGAITKGKSVGIGVAVGVNDLSRNTMAVIGQPVFTGSEAVDKDEKEIDVGYAHGFKTGDAIIYDNGGGTSISGLTSGNTYYAIVTGPTSFKLALTKAAAESCTSHSCSCIEGMDDEHAAGESHFFRLASESQGVGSVNSGGNVVVVARNTGIIGAASIAGVVLNETASGSDATGAEAPGDAGSYGIGVSGSASANIFHDSAVAAISYATVSYAGMLEVLADNETYLISLSGSVLINTNEKGSKSFGLAGAFAWNEINTDTIAYINHSTIIGVAGYPSSGLRVAASNRSYLVTVAASVGVVSKGPGLAGSVSINQITNHTRAFIDNQSSVAVVGPATISAQVKTILVAVGGAIAYGGKKLGFGAAVVISTIVNIVEAFLSDSDLTTSGLLTLLATNNSNIVSVAVALAITKEGKLAAAISVVVSSVDATVTADIRRKKAGGAGISAGGGVLISADDDPDIVAIAGAVGIQAKNEGGGVGAAVNVNNIDSTVRASIDSTSVLASNGNIIVHANQQAMIVSVAIAGAYGATAGLGGSASAAQVDTTTKACITGTSTVNAEGSVVVSARDEFDLVSIAGALGIGKKYGLGVAVAVQDINDDVLAYIDGGSTINARGNLAAVKVDTGTEDSDNKEITQDFKGVAVTATSYEYIFSMAIGGAGGAEIAFAGSLSTNVLMETTHATIGENVKINKDTSNENADQSVKVLASDRTTLTGIGGSIAISGKAGIGVGIDVSVLVKDTIARIGSGADVEAKRDVLVKVFSHEKIVSVSAGLAGGATGGVAGAVDVSVLTSNDQGLHRRCKDGW